jgi:hypothetical protein
VGKITYQGMVYIIVPSIHPWASKAAHFIDFMLLYIVFKFGPSDFVLNVSEQVYHTHCIVVVEQVMIAKLYQGKNVELAWNNY